MDITITGSGGSAYGRVDFYTVKAGFDRGLSSVDVVLDSILHVLLGHLFRNDCGHPGAIPSEMGCTTLEDGCGRRERLSSAHV